jgi:hypothetical protein
MNANQIARAALATVLPTVAKQRLDEWWTEWSSGWWQDMRQRRGHYEQVVQTTLPTLRPAPRECLVRLWAAIKAYQDAETEQARNDADRLLISLVETAPEEHKRAAFEILLDQHPSRLSDDELARLAGVAGVWRTGRSAN